MGKGKFVIAKRKFLMGISFPLGSLIVPDQGLAAEAKPKKHSAPPTAAWAEAMSVEPPAQRASESRRPIRRDALFLLHVCSSHLTSAMIAEKQN
jgi:hypothetical protein